MDRNMTGGTQVPKWQQNSIKKKAKKELMKQSKKFHTLITPMMDTVVSLMVSAKDEDAQNLAVYMCAEIIGGFEEVDQRRFIMDSLKMTMDEYNDASK